MNENNNKKDGLKKKKSDDDSNDDNPLPTFPGFGNIDEFFKKFFEANLNQNLPMDGKSNPNNMHFFNISYKFDGTTEKPEIRINGEPIDENAIKDMMDGMFPEGFDFTDLQNMFGQNLKNNNMLPVIDASEIKLADSDDVINIPRKNLMITDGNQTDAIVDNSDTTKVIPESKQSFETPLMELFEDPKENIAELTLELPGVEKEKISITFSGNDITIVGESESQLYKATQKLRFAPDPKKIIIDGRNGIYQIQFSA